MFQMQREKIKQSIMYNHQLGRWLQFSLHRICHADSIDLHFVTAFNDDTRYTVDNLRIDKVGPVRVYLNGDIRSSHFKFAEIGDVICDQFLIFPDIFGKFFFKNIDFFFRNSTRGEDLFHIFFVQFERLRIFLVFLDHFI